MTRKNEEGLKGLAITGLVLSCMSWVIFGIIFAPMGTIFSAVAMKAKDSTTKTIATAGFVVGVVALAFLFFAFVMVSRYYR